MRSYGRLYWLWCCFGMFLAGCNHAASSSTTRPAPLLSLARPTLTPTMLFRLMRTPTIPAINVAQTQHIPHATMLPLTLAPPTCYENPANSLICTGWLANPTQTAIEGVVVQVMLVDENGRLLDQLRVGTALRVVPSDSATPYNAVFKRIPTVVYGVIAAAVQAVPTTAHAHHPLTSEFAPPRLTEPTVHVTGQVNNTTAKRLNEVSVVITLLDDSDRVLGYRIWQFPKGQAIKPGASASFALEVIPQAKGTKRIIVSAEGQAQP